MGDTLGQYMKSIQYYRVKRWFEIDDQQNLRYAHNLNESSLIFDVGGFKGETTEIYFKTFNCNIWVFEPVEDFANEIKMKFKNNPKVKVFNFGLSDRNSEEIVKVREDSSSVIREISDKRVKANFIRGSDFIREHKLSKIDLMDINIEGGEYELLEDIINTNSIDIIDNVQIQFHDFIANAKERMVKIRSLLSVTHYPTYQYDFVWENWKRKPGINKEYDEFTKDLLTRLDWSLAELSISRERETNYEKNLDEFRSRLKPLLQLKKLLKIK